MAVYERSYKGYRGNLTPEWSRFLVIPEYCFRQVFSSRLFLIFFFACFLLPTLVETCFIYILNNLALLQFLQINAEDADFINATFFLRFIRIQAEGCGFFIALVVGPPLVSADLANNGLPMYFSRPLSRAEYVLGKLFVLVALLSAVSWIPNLMMFFLQSYMAGDGWLWDNLRTGAAIFLGSWVWIITLSLVTLAISAAVKKKMTARILMFGIFFILASFGAIIGQAIGLWWGMNLHIPMMADVVMAGLFGVGSPLPDTPLWSAWGTLIVACGLSVIFLAKKIKAYEIIR